MSQLKVLPFYFITVLKRAKKKNTILKSSAYQLRGGEEEVLWESC